jgi:hypothetical protein
VAESDDSEGVGIIEPTMDDMTDALLPLVGWNEVEDPWVAVTEEPRWVKMWLRGVELPWMERNVSTSLVVREEKFPTLPLPPMAKERGEFCTLIPSGSRQNLARVVEKFTTLPLPPMAKERGAFCTLIP